MHNPEKQLTSTAQEKIYVGNVGKLSAVSLENAKNSSRDKAMSKYEQAKKNALNIDQELGERAREKIEAVQRGIQEYFQELGFENVRPLEVLLTPETVVEKNEMAVALNGHIEIHDPEIEEDKEIKTLQFLKLLAHESYHSVAPTKLRVESNEDESVLNNYVDRVGVTYGKSIGKGRANALEEGLAVAFEERLFADIRKMFDEETNELWDRIQKAIMEKEQSDGKTPIYEEEEIVNIFAWKDGDMQYSRNTTYRDCWRLVKYLENEIPEFHYLVEKTRIEGKTLDLARAVDKRFGKSAFRRIVTTPNNFGHALILELQKEE